MRITRVKLLVTQGNLAEREFIFDEGAHCIIGRASDCDIQIPSDREHANVSRHHCLVEINPPEGVWVCDLGSRNGTYVNGEMIGQGASQKLSSRDETQLYPIHALKDNDEIRVGPNVFRVNIGVTEYSFVALSSVR
jgi:pSer/pThr/pTyr-binding forkhead associated (FHA) protein